MNAPLPPWLREEVRRAKQGDEAAAARQTRRILRGLQLPTVCDSAHCPNRGECYSHGTATFLILGEVCTRRCAFCAVPHDPAPAPPAADEAARLAQAVAALDLAHVVITSVTRDDLTDGGAAHYAQVVAALHRQSPALTVELLVPDFRGDAQALTTVLKARPAILAHNIETVPRLYPTLRSGADYTRSLRLLQSVKRLAPGVRVKSGVMLGLGEEEEEVAAVLHDLAQAGCDILTIGQYLPPSLAHAPVRHYLGRDAFAQWRDRARALGLPEVVSGPLVRSSYRAAASWQNLS